MAACLGLSSCGVSEASLEKWGAEEGKKASKGYISILRQTEHPFVKTWRELVPSAEFAKDACLNLASIQKSKKGWNDSQMKEAGIFCARSFLFEARSILPVIYPELG